LVANDQAVNHNKTIVLYAIAQLTTAPDLFV